ncbi:MAG: translation initiation factor [Pseudobdellovibrio sp.]
MATQWGAWQLVLLRIPHNINLKGFPLSSSKSNQQKDRVLVYSTDPKDQDILSGKIEKDKLQQASQLLVDAKSFVVIFRLEKNGRGGKTVTILDRLPNHQTFVKELLKELKTKCGVGGSFKIESGVGQIEIQGDKRDSIKKILDLKQIKYKGM